LAQPIVVFLDGVMAEAILELTIHGKLCQNRYSKNRAHSKSEKFDPKHKIPNN